jgi:uncharacterized protein with ACT and thioredoxin-like domain
MSRMYSTSFDLLNGSVTTVGLLVLSYNVVIYILYIYILQEAAAFSGEKVRQTTFL